MSKITSKGQVTIPKEIREKFGLEAGEEINFAIVDGQLVLKKKSMLSKLESWAGVISIESSVDSFVDDIRGSE